MLSKLFPGLTRRQDTEPETGGARIVDAPRELFDFAPMTPLMPPLASNDDPLDAACDEVEHELKRAGLIY